MAFFLVRAAALLAAVVYAVPSPQSLKSDLTILINNDLEGQNSPVSSSGVILLSQRSYEDATTACRALGEQLWAPEMNSASIQPNIDYLVLQKKASAASRFWIGPQRNSSRVVDALGVVSLATPDQALPALCTQTAPYSTPASGPPSEKWQVGVHSNEEDLVGYRDRLSFRFAGVRYAAQPKRFTYSTLHNGTGGSVSAIKAGSQCTQAANVGSEDCLFLNIFTPFLPNLAGAAEKKGLKPVMFWIHGGAFTGGTGSDDTVDGGNMASRGDVVVVTINYRLNTLGFLALNDGQTNGNYGLADQITALDWVRAHIQDFGGDPDKITIFGQSAGAGSVRALMASPMAEGKFAGAIPLSNLGGLNYGTTYSKYYTIKQEAELHSKAILAATNCTSAASQVDCLRSVPANTLASLGTVSRYIVVDGTYITRDELPLIGPRLPIALMMGTTHDDGTPFIKYPNTTDTAAYLKQNGFDVPPPDLFPIPALGSNQTLSLYNMSSRLATDAIFRCVDQATVQAGLEHGRFERVFYYEFDRTYQTTGWPGSAECNPPVTAGRPHGDPSLPYFRCHSGELYYVFGNLARQSLPMRDEADLPFEQFVVDSFAAFGRTGNPNPDAAFLAARGYNSTLKELEKAGPWAPSVRGKNNTMRVLNGPGSYQGPFREALQCEGLGIGLDYYKTGWAPASR